MYSLVLLISFEEHRKILKGKQRKGSIINIKLLI